MFNVGKIVSVFVSMIVLIVLISLIFALPVMLLWNGCVVPAIDGVREITWLQAWGIMILCNVLFKSNAEVKH